VRGQMLKNFKESGIKRNKTTTPKKKERQTNKTATRQHQQQHEIQE
jgi:protein required for attachment to host cells